MPVQKTGILIISIFSGEIIKQIEWPMKCLRNFCQNLKYETNTIHFAPVYSA